MLLSAMAFEPSTLGKEHDMRFLHFAALAAAALFTLADASKASADAGTVYWFNDGLAWYQHPCGFQTFAKYGKTDTPEIRRAYYATIDHPEMCSTLFP